MRIIKAARGRVTGQFGDRNVPGANVPAHLGMDLGHGDMTPDDLRVGAPAPGTVTAAGWSGTYGNRLIINHGRDAGGDRWESLLAHLSAFRVGVGAELGTYGAECAVMGGTGGNWPVHLHQELRRNGVPVNPEHYLASLAELEATPLVPEPEPIPKEDIMALIRTEQHGHYTAVPGVVIAHPDTRITSGVEFRDWGVVMDVAPDDLAAYLFALAGCPKGEIPAGGSVWYGRPNA
ncbi:murein hydrolase activator EnvC family protein [Agromyces sp. CCNWLW203]|uniref:murein hydrolase activator EnvC family protein n=1 Tax=Agromyces sp. CCNWLW203 TaxID=3112842 RepID=UPI002F96D4E3